MCKLFPESNDGIFQKIPHRQDIQEEKASWIEYLVEYSKKFQDIQEESITPRNFPCIATERSQNFRTIRSHDMSPTASNRLLFCSTSSCI